MPFSNSFRSLQRPESGKIKMLIRSHSVVVILTIHAEQAAKDEARDFSCHCSLDSVPRRVLRRTGRSMLRDWNMDKAHEVGA